MSVTIDDITYTYSGSTAEVQTFVPGITTANIPSTIFVSPDTYNVTSIGISAFQGCTTLTSVTIPNSVTSIGQQAFYSCTSLNSATIGSSVTTIGDYAFQGCSALTSITIPDSVTSIGVSAFQYCTLLASVTLPINPLFTTIGIAAFFQCSALTSITIPNSVTSIGDQAFYSCTSLNSAIIGSSVTTIGNSAFQSCSALTSVTIPNSVTIIGQQAFQYCTLLASVTLPINPLFITIGTQVFQFCSALTSVTIPNSVTSIGNNAFQYCTLLASATIGSSVTTIGISAFEGCSALTSVTIHNSVISIGDQAFAGCSSLTSLSIGSSVTSIGVSAFQGCSALTSVTIPNSVTTIGDLAFYLCASLNLVYFLQPLTLPTIGTFAFGDISTPSEGKYYATVTDTTPIDPPVFTSISTIDTPPTEYPCFLEGTKILCFENNEDVYREIESLRKGDLVKTIYNGYMPIHMIGTTSIYNPGNDYRVTNRLYKCSREKYPTLFEDLYITGCHSILVPRMTQDQWDNTKAVNGTIYVTDNHFRLIACADEKAEPFNKEGFMNIYHIALEHQDILMNYGIYANGLLVESCSERNLRYLSNMRILGEEDCSISKHVENVFIMRHLVDTY
jgi:hypothetical protein